MARAIIRRRFIPPDSIRACILRFSHIPVFLNNVLRAFLQSFYGYRNNQLALLKYQMLFQTAQS